MTDATGSHHEELDAIIGDYLQAVDAGQVPSRDALLAEHPQHAEALRRFFADYDQLDNRADALMLAHSTEAPVRPMVPYFGDYELLEEVARGGMGVVYKARQASLNRLVALKMIVRGQLATARDVARFRAEAEAAANLDHPNIVPIYEVGEQDGQQYYAMRFIDGAPLNRRPRSDARSEARLIATVAHAVHFAHQRGLIHRDIKPSNILIDQAGIPCVADFGLAKRFDQSGADLTVSGEVIGTPRYMAPEQAAGRKDLTVAVDIYSLGVVFYERLTGRTPFTGETVLDVLRQVREHEPPQPSSIVQGLPKDLETICLKCLDKQPVKRYSSAEALSDDLDRWVRGEPIQARPVGRIERAIKWLRRHPLQTALSVSLVLGIAGTTAFALRSREQAQRAEQQLLRSEWLIYASQIENAQQALNAKDWQEARRYLSECRWNFRGFEWDYLATRLRRKSTGAIASPVPEIAGKMTKKPVFLSNDGQRRIAWDGHEGTVYDAMGGEFRTIQNSFSPGIHHDSMFHDVAIEPNRGFVATHRQDGENRVVELSTLKTALKFSGWCRYLAFSPDGNRFAVVEGQKHGPCLRVWQTSTWQENYALPLKNEPKQQDAYAKAHISFVMFSPEGRRIITDAGAPLKEDWAVIDLESGTILKRIGSKFRTPTSQTQLLAIGPDCQTLIFGEMSGMMPTPFVSVNDAVSGREITRIATREFPRRMQCAACSPDGRRLATLAGGLLEIWSLPIGQRVFSIPVPPDEGVGEGEWHLAFRPDGRALIPVEYWPQSASQVFLIEPWDASDPIHLRLLEAYRGNTLLETVSFSLDGKHAVGLARRGDNIVWDLSTGRLIPGVTESCPKPSVVTSADGRYGLKWRHGGAAGNSLVDIRVVDLTKPGDPSEDNEKN